MNNQCLQYIFNAFVSLSILFVLVYLFWLDKRLKKQEEKMDLIEEEVIERQGKSE